MKPHYTTDDPGLHKRDHLLVAAIVCALIAFVLLIFWLYPAHAHADSAITDAVTLSDLTATSIGAPAPACGIGKVTKCYRNSAGLFGSVRWGHRVISKRLAVCWIGMPVPVCAR